MSHSSTKHEIRYRIVNRRTRKFSDGGVRPRFSAKGKYWKTMAHLRAHLKIVRDREEVYKDCVLHVEHWEKTREFYDVLNPG